MRRWICGIALAGVAAAASEARAYDFWTRARTLGQAYELRSFRVRADEVSITRRRLTQLVTLVLHDLGDLERARRRAGRVRRGPLVSWRATLRLDHDFGTYLSGRLPFAPTSRQDALDQIPDLADSALDLSLLYGQLRVEGLFDDRLALAAGRIAPLALDAPPPFDGAWARAEVTSRVAVEVAGGLVVRESSWLGVSSYDPDGTAGAYCHEYVEAAQGQPGRWRLLRRDERITDGRFTSDFEQCPQRLARMPMADIALAMGEVGGVSARVSYRLARSATASKGASDPTDPGLYPDEVGQAPAWGTNIEQLSAVASARWARGGWTIEPLASMRASIAHGLVDRAELSTVLRRGDHAVTPALSRVVPTFDTDSIWNVFAGEEESELSLAYAYDGPWRGAARLWGRRFDGAGAPAWAWGSELSAAHQVARLAAQPLTVRGRAVADTGIGGARLIGDAELRWGGAGRQLAARAALVWSAPDSVAGAAQRATSAATSARLSWALSSGVNVQSALELSRAGSGELSARAFAALELTLEPNR